MADIAEIRSRVRTALGDLGDRFSLTLAGGQSSYQLGYRRVSDLVVHELSGSTVSEISPDGYELDAYDGIIRFPEPIPDNHSLLITGREHGLFTDNELDRYIDTAVKKHCYERETVERKRNEKGFIVYERTPITLENLPEIEESALVILATIEALWDLATDAATDVDVWTAEGTHLSRAQRYNQLMQHLDVLTQRYQTLCQQLNIGLNRIEVYTLRRVSYTTGRLVPIFREREYDEVGPGAWPKRLLPPIDSPNEDESGIPSPIAGGWGP